MLSFILGALAGIVIGAFISEPVKKLLIFLRNLIKRKVDDLDDQRED